MRRDSLGSYFQCLIGRWRWRRRRNERLQSTTDARILGRTEIQRRLQVSRLRVTFTLVLSSAVFDSSFHT